MNKLIKVCLVICLLITCIGTTAFAASRPADDGKKTFVIRMGNTATWPNQPNWIMREFKKRIEASTKRITVQLYEGSAFGGPNEMIQGLQSGAMQTVLIPSGFYGSAVPAIGLLDLPGLFADPDELLWVLNQDTPKLDAYMGQQGCVPIGWFYEVRRDFLTLRPVEKLADFKGMNLRTYTVDVSQQNIRAIGANPVIMGTADVPMALQQKTIDGCEAGVSMMAAAKYYELAKYFLIELGAPLANPAVFSQAFLDQLPQELYDLVVNTMRELCVGEEGTKYAKDYCDSVYKEMSDNGCVVTEASPEFQADYLAATAPLTPDFLKQYPFMEPVYEEITDLVKQYRTEIKK